MNENEILNNNENNNVKTKKKSKSIIIIFILVIILVLLVSVYFLYTNGLLNNFLFKEEAVLEEVEPNILKTYEFKLGNYYLITEETDEFKDGQEIKLGDISEEEKTYKVVLIEKGLYNIESMQEAGALVQLYQYQTEENVGEDRVIENKDIKDIYDTFDFSSEYKKFSQRPITDNVNIMTISLPTRYDRQNREEINNIIKTDNILKLSLLDKQPTNQSFKNGTKIYLEDNIDYEEYYEIGKNIPEGIYDLVLEEGEKLTVKVENYENGEYGFSVVLKNQYADNRIIINNMELKNGNRLYLQPMYFKADLNRRLEKDFKIALIAREKLNQEFVPIDRTLKNTAIGTGEVLKTFDITEGNYRINQSLDEYNENGETRYTEFVDSDDKYKAVRLDIPKGVYNIELTSGIYAKFTILESGYEGVDFENDIIIFNNTDNFKNISLKERYLDDGVLLLVSKEGMPEELKQKENNINIKLTQIDKTIEDSVTRKNGKSYEIKEKSKGQLTTIGSDIPEGTYDIETVGGIRTLVSIKDKNGNLKQITRLEKTGNKSRTLIKDAVLKEGDTIEFESEFLPGALHYLRRLVTLKLTTE